MYKMFTVIKLCTKNAQKSLKMRKMNDVLHKYFQEDCRYDSDCFRRLKYTLWATSHPNIMAQRPI